jgi:phosphate:Na+ symporter
MISLNQAAAMVIGMDVGTTATAAMASVGGNVHARRTGFAHVIYNLMTGVAAFLILTPYMAFVEAALPGTRRTEPELVLVGFHTFFNTLGVIAVLPFTDRFASLIIRLFPERGNPLTQQLDRSLLADPNVAISAVGHTLWDVTTALLGELERRLREIKSEQNIPRLNDVTDAIAQTNGYLQELSARLRADPQVRDYAAYMHVLDHLRRIDSRVREEQRFGRCRDDELLSAMSERLLAAIEIVRGAPRRISAEQAELIHSINRELKTAMRAYRASVLEESSLGKLSTSEALGRMDTARSLRRIGYYIWRIAYHLAEPGTETLSRRHTE